MCATCGLLTGYELQGASDVSGGSKVLLTGDEQYILRLAPGRTAASSVVLTDVQKGSASLVEGPFVARDIQSLPVYIIDKVLKSGEWGPG